METDIPLDLIKQERRVEQQIADLQARLARSDAIKREGQESR
jgi:hypothetical protein